jgi:hypothetical protein
MEYHLCSIDLYWSKWLDVTVHMNHICVLPWVLVSYTRACHLHVVTITYKKMDCCLCVYYVYIGMFCNMQLWIGKSWRHSQMYIVTTCEAIGYYTYNQVHVPLMWFVRDDHRWHISSLYCRVITNNKTIPGRYNMLAIYLISVNISVTLPRTCCKLNNNSTTQHKNITKNGINYKLSTQDNVHNLKLQISCIVFKQVHLLFD